MCILNRTLLLPKLTPKWFVPIGSETNLSQGPETITMQQRHWIWTTVVPLGFLLLTAVASPASVLAQESESPEKLAFFETKIRPVLVEHCYACHSEEANAAGKLQGGLLLDRRQGWQGGGESGPAVAVGKPTDSLLIQALRYDGIEMPPAGKLPDGVIKDFERWVSEGAIDPREGIALPKTKAIDWETGRQLWSIQPLAEYPHSKAPIALPSDSESIDALVDAQQSERGLTRSPIADARTLIRRAWLDLTGIPPTPEELKRWTARLQGDAPGSIQRESWKELLDELLARPEYGERWARHWMDIARFAESYGYEQDYDRPNAFHYRDFLIRAFNEDLPFDRFVHWQIAGDQLAPDNPQAWMATGFLGAGAFPTQLTETEFESTRYNELDDMTTTTGVAFLGLSLGCARCHDHKFDPISAEDYYRFTAAFTEAIRCEKSFDLDPASNQQRREQFVMELASAKTALAEWEQSELPKLLTAWLEQSPSVRNEQAGWSTLSGELTSSEGSRYQLQADGSYLATGIAPDRDVLTFVVPPIPFEWSSLQIEALSDPSLPQQGPGRAPNGNFALGNLMVEQLDSEGRIQKLELSKPRSTHQQNVDSLSIAASIDSDPISGWAVDGQIGKSHAAAFSLASPIVPSPDHRVRITLSFPHPNPKHAMGRMRFSVHRSPDASAEVGSGGPPAAVAEAIERLSTAIAQQKINWNALRLDPSWKTVGDWYRTTLEPWRALQSKIHQLESTGPKVEQTRVMVTSEGLPHLPHHADDRGYPHFYRETHLLRRGDVSQKVRVMQPGYPQVFDRKQSGRFDFVSADSAPGSEIELRPRASLARWMTDMESGAGSLVARVIVNRLWQHHFGKGIVATPNDFGQSGQPPTHPMLLESLARKLVDSGWSLKSLHREIMSSQAYMQSGAIANDPRFSIDPENLFLWHYAPRRLEAEAIRDSMLKVSGALDPRMYGPGSLDPQMKRRSIYFFIKRSQLIPSMMLFDWPEHLVSIGQRQSTTIAPQALMFMNNEPVRALAQSFAKKFASNDPSKSIEQAYAEALGRLPNETERETALRFYQDACTDQQANHATEPELAALTDFCQILFSLNEFIFID